MKSLPVKILIVDDDEDDFFIIKQYINKIEGRQFIIDWCPVYKEATEKICEGVYDLYFVDYHLQVKTGLELIQESIANNCEEPFILLTGNGSYKIDNMAMESGAVDYLIKDELSTEKLERCIRYSLGRAASLKALKASERKFRNIFEKSKDIIFIAATGLTFIEVNEAAPGLLGYSKTEMLSQSLYNFLAYESDKEIIEQRLTATGSISEKEVVLLNKKGEKIYCILALSAETDIKGVIYVQGIIHDISLLKKAERTNILLEKLNVTNRLVRVMAHEVRNPLNNILLSAEQLELPLSKDKPDVFLDIINRNGKRIENIIAELLNSLRPAEVSIEKRSLQSIIDESIEAAIDRITLRRIQLQKKYPDDPAWVMADDKKLKIVFLNIIINAVEAISDDEGELNILVEKKEDQYIVSIEDNGCGISDEHLLHLFEPYFTSKKNGMGLGLASALNILQSHNASFDVQTKLNKGTVFKLFFGVA